MFIVNIALVLLCNGTRSQPSSAVGSGTTGGTTTTTVSTTPVVNVATGNVKITLNTTTGTQINLSSGATMSFDLAGQTYGAVISYVYMPTSTASLTINNTTKVNLKVGVSQIIDLNNDGYLDVDINLQQINSDTELKLLVKKLTTASTGVEETTETTTTEIAEGDNVVYMTGRWVKIPNNPAVYFLDSNNVRHAYFSQKIWESYFGTNFSRVETISATELSNYTLGANVPFNGGSLIKATTSPKVYKVTANGELLWIKTEAVAKKYFGTDWAKKIIDLSDPIFIQYKVIGSLE